jgi:hypothetical protein
MNILRGDFCGGQITGTRNPGTYVSVHPRTKREIREGRSCSVVRQTTDATDETDCGAFGQHVTANYVGMVPNSRSCISHSLIHGRLRQECVAAIYWTQVVPSRQKTAWA